MEASSHVLRLDPDLLELCVDVGKLYVDLGELCPHFDREALESLLDFMDRVVNGTKPVVSA